MDARFSEIFCHFPKLVPLISLSVNKQHVLITFLLNLRTISLILQYEILEKLVTYIKIYIVEMRKTAKNVIKI